MGLKSILAAKFGSRFKSIMLYGSEANGHAEKDSDIDIFILLEGPVFIGADLESAITATYSLQMQIDRPLHFSICDFREYEAGKFSLYRTIKKEGLAA